MKKAIEKAMENGFDLRRFTPCKTRKYKVERYTINSSNLNQHIMTIVYSNKKDSSTDYGYVYFYRLLFGSNFLECLVGEGNKGRCSCEEDNMAICLEEVLNMPTDKHNPFIDKCPMYIKNIADYHRQQMANLKDVNKLKKYVEGLA